jgi:hypothetical protein
LSIRNGHRVHLGRSSQHSRFGLSRFLDTRRA